MHLRLLPTALCLTAVAAAQAQEPAPAPAPAAPSGRLREIRIATGDVFDPQRAAERPLERLVNSLHWATRRDVIEREIWFAPGDHVDGELAAELERNLRALGLFADVTVRLVATDTPGVVDLEVATRDRLTLSFGAGASYVGGVGGVNAALGESNLLGLGDRLAASFRTNTEDEYRGGIAYTDLHVLDTWHTGTVRLGRTDDGDYVGVDLRRPFRHLADPYGYGASFDHAETAVDYHRDGDTLAEVPDRRTSLGLHLDRGSGPALDRRRIGLTAAFDDHDYGLATGPLAPAVRVPGDTWSAFVGATGGWRLVTGFRKVEGLDTLVFVQDLELGLDVGGTLGARWRDEAGTNGALQPELALHARWSAAPTTDLFTVGDVSGRMRWDDGDAVGWFASASGRAFVMLHELHTLCGRIVFDAAEETQDLPVELTLGEDLGLRGYANDQLVGTHRLRANLEHRFDTDVEFATLHFGLVAFGDAGWIGDGSALGRPFTAAGLGLRIGSKPLLGGGLLRIDVAKPFVDVVGDSDGWKVSVTLGQVFGFGS
ncbi:MAG: hypothetical protein JNL08_02705 [Planctomycetes bacterium]|nr:hypothetical protein [Planctomycetota bacterium]